MTIKKIFPICIMAFLLCGCVSSPKRFLVVDIAKFSDRMKMEMTFHNGNSPILIWDHPLPERMDFGPHDAYTYYMGDRTLVIFLGMVAIPNYVSDDSFPGAVLKRIPENQTLTRNIELRLPLEEITAYNSLFDTGGAGERMSSYKIDKMFIVWGFWKADILDKASPSSPGLQQTSESLKNIYQLQFVRTGDLSSKDLVPLIGSVFNGREGYVQTGFSISRFQEFLCAEVHLPTELDVDLAKSPNIRRGTSLPVPLMTSQGGVR